MCGCSTPAAGRSRVCACVGGALLCVCAPQLRERNADKIQRMSRGEVSVFDELFSYSCPKFITAVPPAYDNPSVNTSQQVCWRTHLLQGNTRAGPMRGRAQRRGAAAPPPAAPGARRGRRLHRAAM